MLIHPLHTFMHVLYMCVAYLNNQRVNDYYLSPCFDGFAVGLILWFFLFLASWTMGCLRGSKGTSYKVWVVVGLIDVGIDCERKCMKKGKETKVNFVSLIEKR